MNAHRVGSSRSCAKKSVEHAKHEVHDWRTWGGEGEHGEERDRGDRAGEGHRGQSSHKKKKRVTSAPVKCFHSSSRWLNVLVHTSSSIKSNVSPPFYFIVASTTHFHTTQMNQTVKDGKVSNGRFLKLVSVNAVCKNTARQNAKQSDHMPDSALGADMDTVNWVQDVQ